MKLIHNNWHFRYTGCAEVMPCTVPGCNFLDLMANGKIPEPFVALNEKEVEWVGETDFEYFCSFNVSQEELSHERIYLHAMMLDTVCDVFINEIKVGEGKNCHIAYDFEVKEVLKPGENSLRIKFKSPLNYVRELYSRSKTPPNLNGENGIVRIRKPQCHFGWDWGPVLPVSGITKNIGLEFYSFAKLDNLKIEQTHINSRVDLTVNAEIERFNDDAIECEITVFSPNNVLIKKQVGESAHFTIEKPELWWTNDISGKKEQPLYTVKAVLKKNGEEIDTLTKKIGLRTIRLNRENDKQGSNFQFILNGVPLFIKGANYIPADSFITRFDDEKRQKMIDAVLFSNMNLLRIWGGGYYADDELFELCDKNGILIWQDFMFACQVYPFFEKDFLENVLEEVASNVNRIRHHASLALYCGNNEIEQMSKLFFKYKNYIAEIERFFYELLPSKISEYDSITAYIPGSPCGSGRDKNIGSDNHGDTHIWAVWHGMQNMSYFKKRLTRFCSEFGFESLPDMKTIEYFAGKEEKNLKSSVFSAHQKCPKGNETMLYYILDRFRKPKNFKDFIYYSQIVQMQSISNATEFWRQNRGTCNGAVYWQLNDCWPVCSWSGMDYFGNYKALQYAARRFNAPLSVSINETKNKAKLFIINDKNKSYTVSVRYKIFDFEKGVLEENKVTTTVNALENKETFVFNLKSMKKKFNIKSCGISAELILSEHVISVKTLLFGLEKNLSLPKTNITRFIEILEDKIEITLKSDKFARLVCLESSNSTESFSDNYFDILPGESRKITQKLDMNLSPQEQINGLNVYSVSDIETVGTKFTDALRRLAILLKPKSFGAFIVYHFIK